MSEATPSLTLDLAWEEALRFSGRCGEAAMTLDSDGKAGPSPVQALAFSLAGCMSIDIVHILGRARVPLSALSARLRAWRAPQDPRRILRVALHFVAAGEVPPDRLERAIALSREKYCSVWHSLRQDIAFETSFEVAAGP